WAPIGDVTRAYCATSYGSDSATAMEAAVAYSRRKVAVGLSPADRKLYDAGDAKVAATVAAKAAAEWDPSTPGSCAWTKVGIWAGKPLDYDAAIGLTKE